MQESKGREGTQRSESKEQLGERFSEATNDATLSELEENQKLGDKAKMSERDVPAPDSEPSEPRKERDDAGPM
ncbi:MAG: hypothetical protein ACREBG_27975 [Pyrinomonadaceae bacterium]